MAPKPIVGSALAPLEASPRRDDVGSRCHLDIEGVTHDRNQDPHMDEATSQRFHDLYVAHYAAILGYCLRRMGHDEAHDTAAETFVVAWRRIADVPHGDKALPWLYGVAAKTLANRRRSRSRRRRLDEKLRGLRMERQTTPDVQVIRRSEDQQIVDAINRLRPLDREILLLSAWDDLTRRQLADRFGISVSAAEQRLTRAKRRLAAELKREVGWRRLVGENTSRESIQ